MAGGFTITHSRLTQATIDFDVPARMRDGVVLRANVYRPAGERTVAHLADATALREGRSRSRQQVRSDPRRPLRIHGRHPGHSGALCIGGRLGAARVRAGRRVRLRRMGRTVAGSNGRVGMCGESYYGYTQWAAAVEQPPSLAAICAGPDLVGSDGRPLRARRRGRARSCACHGRFSKAPITSAACRSPDEERARRVESLLDDYDDARNRGVLASADR